MKMEFNDQLQLFENHLNYFDNEEKLEYKIISTSLRKFLHDTRISKSLFTSLDLKNRDFFSTIDDKSFTKRGNFLRREQVSFYMFIETLKRRIIILFIFIIDNDWRMIVCHQEVIH